MNEEIKKIIEYFKNDNWYTIFNAEECNDEPYKLLNPIEVNQIIEYTRKLQNNWNELKKLVEEEIKHLEKSRYVSFNEYGENKLRIFKDFKFKMQELQGDDKN